MGEAHVFGKMKKTELLLCCAKEMEIMRHLKKDHCNIDLFKSVVDKLRDVSKS